VRRTSAAAASTPSAPSSGGAQIATRSTAAWSAPPTSARATAPIVQSKNGGQIGGAPSGWFM
jgi:hypothetical protein